ncbi:hypothetical protein GWK47_021558 [Chionoecetes opilio]|uniref:Uncharacterized protein n=1 Tax=Chionoecetes opilio TaxID=41210 RepID=A0A8J5CHU8_CHIOP|nr:hypothetical protein GWK47_021558 [Chionoecetes opilio]
MSVSTSWICSVRTKKNRCFASVSQQGNTFTRGPKEHNHGGNPGAQLRAQAISLDKAAAREDIYKSSGKIVTDTLLTHATDEVQLPKVSNLQRTANRTRQQLRPKHPTDLEFEIATAHIPTSHINNAFNQLKDRCPQVQTAQAQKLHKLLNYLEKTWITSASCPPSTWSTYKRVVRTNNEVEGWHHRLNHNSPTKRMNLYLLINTLYDETKLLPLQVRLITQNKICRIQSKKTQSKQQKLKQLWTDYENHDMITSEYLRKCSELADHGED